MHKLVLANHFQTALKCGVTAAIIETVHVTIILDTLQNAHKHFSNSSFLRHYEQQIGNDLEQKLRDLEFTNSYGSGVLPAPYGHIYRSRRIFDTFVERFLDLTDPMVCLELAENITRNDGFDKLVEADIITEADRLKIFRAFTKMNSSFAALEMKAATQRNRPLVTEMREWIYSDLKEKLIL